MSLSIVKELLGKNTDKKDKYKNININLKKINNVQKHKDNIRKKVKNLEIYKKKITKINRNVLNKIKKFS